MESQSCTEGLIRQPATGLLRAAIERLDQRFRCYATYSSAPLPAPGLVITPEIRYQCERYLPMHELKRLFERYYRAALCYEPILSSSPCHTALSWADWYASLPSWLQHSANPARLLTQLLADRDLHERFLFASFLPPRFNGPGFGRYPGQAGWLREWVTKVRVTGKTGLRCLDAACGSGEGCWELAEQLQAAGWQPSQVQLQGWTLDPLEVCAARYQYLPHLSGRQQAYRQRTGVLKAGGWAGRISFQAADLLADQPLGGSFDLILCNGLVGGPMINQQAALEKVLNRLAGLLAAGGALLLADQFHGGWHKKTPETMLGGLCRRCGLKVIRAGEGLAALKADQ